MNKIILTILTILILFPASVLAETVGFFSKIEGRVDILKEGAARAAPINVNDTVSLGDIVRTKSDGKAEITFKDDSTVRVASESRLKIDEYTFNPDNTRKRGVLDLFRGKIRAVVSKSKAIIPIGSTTSSFDVNTPTAIAGVRGTDLFVFHDRGITGVIFKEGQGFVVNPNVPERVVNVSAGQVTFVVKPDAPPSAPRPATGMELAVHSKDTTPTEKPKEKKDEGDKTKEEKKTVEAKKEDKEGKKDEGKKDGKTEDKKGDGKLAEAKPANGNGGEKPTAEAPKTVEAAPQAAVAEQAAPVVIVAAPVVDIIPAASDLLPTNGGTAFGYTAPTETLLTAITDVVAESATLTDGSLDTLNILPITEFKETLITDGTTTTLTNLFGGVLYADNSSYPSYCLYNCGNFASLPWDSLYPDELTQSGFMQGAFGGNDLWSGSPTFYAAGTYSNPNNRPLWYADIEGGATDGGLFLGITAGITQYNSLEGRLIGIYIRPDGTTGYIKSSDIFGAFDGASLWYATGTLTSYQMGATYVPPSYLYSDSPYLDYGSKSYGSIGGAVTGSVAVESLELIDQNWGIWYGPAAGNYSTPPPANWNAKVGGEDYDAYENIDGYWLGTISGTDWSNGRLAGTISGKGIGTDYLTTFSGELLGTYDAYGNWQGVTLGTYTDTPLKFVSPLLIYPYTTLNTFDGLITYAFMGGTQSLWTGASVPVTAMGGYSSSTQPHIFKNLTYSWNYSNSTYTTYDNGAYYGSLIGTEINKNMDARLFGLYINPYGNAGYIIGSLGGAAYSGINMFEMDGNILPIAIGSAGISANLLYSSIIMSSYSDGGTNMSFGFDGLPMGSAYSRPFNWTDYERRISSVNDWGYYEIGVSGYYTGIAPSNNWTWETVYITPSLNKIVGTYTAGTQWSNNKILGKTYGYSADITSTPKTWISVGETIGVFEPSTYVFNAAQTGAWLETNKFLAMRQTAEGQAALTALNIPFVEVGRANLTGSGTMGGAPINVNMNDTTFFAYSNGAAPKIWATNNISGSYGCSACGSTTVGLTGSGLSANFNVQTFDTSTQKWIATVDNGVGGFNGSTTFNGAAAGTNTGIGPGTFTGTAAGAAK